MKIFTMLMPRNAAEGRLQEPCKFPESANILSSTSVFQNKLALRIGSCHSCTFNIYANK
jgi:hypothetical protein